MSSCRGTDLHGVRFAYHKFVEACSPCRSMLGSFVLRLRHFACLPPRAQPAAMLPLIDMCNHSFSPNAKIAPGPGGAMCMVATRWGGNV